MKILLVNNCHYYRGGADNVYFNTGELLKRKGHTVIYFSIYDEKNIITGDNEYFIPKSVDVSLSTSEKIKNALNYFYNHAAKKKIEQLIKIEKPDIAHIHLLFGGLTPSILPVLKKNKIPVVHSVHDYRLICPAYTFVNSKGEICEECRNGKYVNCFKNRCSKGDKLQSAVMATEMYFRNYLYKTKNYFQGIIYVSEFSKQLHHSFNQELKLINSEVIYNSYTANLINTAKKDIYYLYFGRLSNEKGLKTLVSAFRILKKIKLKIVGTGPLYNELKETVETEKLTNIEITGYKTGEELTTLVSSAKFVVLPSEWYENNPLSIIESYAYNTPVIGSRIGGIPEILIENETGFLFKAGNIDDLISKVEVAEELLPENYENLCRSSRDFYNINFNEELHYKKLIALYDKLIINRL